MSVIITAYNAERFIAEAIESVLRQTHCDFEFTVVDDGSSDKTPEIIRNYARADRRIRVVAHDNWGVARSMNHAIDLATSDWIVHMDADDVMLPNRIERQVSYISENPDVSVASTLVHMIDECGHRRWTTSTDLVDRATFDQYRRKHRTMPLFHPAVIMKKAAVVEVGGYRPQFQQAPDMDLWARMVDQGHLLLIQPEPLLEYRVHESSVSVANRSRQFEAHRWSRRCSALRCEGLPEPSLEEFRHYERSQPLGIRLNRARVSTSQVLYQRCTFLYINGMRRSALIPLAGALLLEPKLWASRVRPKVASTGFARSVRRRATKVAG